MTNKTLFDDHHENINNFNEYNRRLNAQTTNMNGHTSYPQGQPWNVNEARLHQQNEQIPYQDDHVFPEDDEQPPSVPPQEIQYSHPSADTDQNEENPNNQALDHCLTPDPSQHQSAVLPITQEADSFPDKKNKMTPQEEERVTPSKSSQSNKTLKQGKEAQNTSNTKPRKTRRLEIPLALEHEKILPHLITTHHATLVSLLKEYDISQENLLFNTKDVDISYYESEMLLYLHTHIPIVFKVSKEGKPTYYELVAGIRWKGMYDHLIYNGVINKNKEFTVAVVTKEKNSAAMNDHIKQHLIWEIRERLKRKEERPNGRDERTNSSKHLRSVLESLCKNSLKS